MKSIVSTFAFLSIVSLSTTAQSPEILWWFDTNDSAFGSAAAADIDADGNLELVFGCYRNDSTVYALNAEDGSLLWKRNLAGFAEGCNDVAPIISDIDLDGSMEVVVPSSCNPKTFAFNGANGATEWSTDLHGSDSPPTIADVDGDNKPEILHGNFGGSVSCLNGEDGSIEWDLSVDPNSWIQTAPAIMDVDNNDVLDFVVGNWSFGTNHKIFCYRADNQELLWDSDLPNEPMYHGTSFADIDSDGFIELVIGSYDGSIYVLNAEDGSEHWTFSFPNAVYTAAATSIADLNNDDYYEIVFFDFNMVGVLSHTGTLLWDYTIPSLGQSFRGAAISDINNDEILDVVFGASNGSLYALSGNNGSLIWSLDLAAHYGNPNFEIDHGPVIADFNNDGLLDVFVVGGHTEFPDFSGNYGRAYAITTNSLGGPDWLMFRRDSTRSGTVPINISTPLADPEGIEFDFKLFPNPSKGIVAVELDLVAHRSLSLNVYDSKGRLVETPLDGKDLNERKLFLNEKGLYSKGIYLAVLNIDSSTFTRKFLIW